MEKKYFFNQSSKYHMIKYSFVTDGCRRGWSRKYLKMSVNDCVYLERRKENNAYLSFLFGAPPPIHQSTIQRSAFKLSSRPPFPFPLSAMLLRVSNGLILCSGLLCTRSVSALSLSDRVPDWIILVRKLASDEDELEEEEDWNVRMSVSCSSAALVVCADS